MVVIWLQSPQISPPKAKKAKASGEYPDPSFRGGQQVDIISGSPVSRVKAEPDSMISVTV